MPTCRDCHGTGQRDIKEEITMRCPECDSTKRLKDGSTCKTCNKWGEVGTEEFNTEKKLCKTCMGSGHVSEGSLTAWYLARAIPTTLLLLGGGLAAIWAAWSLAGLLWLAALLTGLVFGLWGGLMYYFADQLPNLGEISALNWFLIRAIPTTVASLAIGGAIVGSLWVYLENAPVTAIAALAAFAIWGTLMFFFISSLPE